MTQSVRFICPVVCTGTKQNPGCGKSFYATTVRQRFCAACAKLDKKSSYVFAERRQLRAALLAQKDGG